MGITGGDVIGLKPPVVPKTAKAPVSHGSLSLLALAWVVGKFRNSTYNTHTFY